MAANKQKQKKYRRKKIKTQLSIFLLQKKSVYFLLYFLDNLVPFRQNGREEKTDAGN